MNEKSYDPDLLLQRALPGALQEQRLDKLGGQKQKPGKMQEERDTHVGGPPGIFLVYNASHAYPPELQCLFHIPALG